MGGESGEKLSLLLSRIKDSPLARKQYDLIELRKDTSC